MSTYYVLVLVQVDLMLLLLDNVLLIALITSMLMKIYISVIQHVLEEISEILLITFVLFNVLLDILEILLEDIFAELLVLFRLNMGTLSTDYVLSRPAVQAHTFMLMIIRGSV